MAKKRKKKGFAGNGMGSHHETSPMGHATRTKSRLEKRRARDRRAKQRGWQ